jgi:hypothetical protein
MSKIEVKTFPGFATDVLDEINKLKMALRKIEKDFYGEELQADSDILVSSTDKE